MPPSNMTKRMETNLQPVRPCATVRIDLDLLEDLRRVSVEHDVPMRRLVKDAVLALKATDPRFRFDEQRGRK